MSDVPTKPQFSKRMVFLAILAGAAGLAGIISLVSYSFLDRSTGRELRLAVVAPLSGPQQALGQAMVQGLSLLVEQTNRNGGIKGQKVRVDAFDDRDDPEQARRAAEQAAASGAVGVVGHWSAAAAASAGEIYREREVPAIAISAAAGSDAAADPWLFHTDFDRLFEIRFLANYVRNVVGEKTVSVILADTPENRSSFDAFDEILRRFGTKILFRWDYPQDARDLDQRADAIAADIVEKKLIGVVLVLGDASADARIIAALRKAGVRNRVVGPGELATNAFTSAFRDAWSGKGSLAAALNGTLTITPLLFDTAGEMAENFRNAFVNRYRTPPDWVAAGAYDAGRMILHSLGPTPDGGEPALSDQRRQVRDHLAHLGAGGVAYHGLMGTVAFDKRGTSPPTAQAGSYDGEDLIAALTQLSPIREENVSNYLDELFAGRALYVNDRFMYKTNVVYAGIKLEKIGALSFGASAVDLEFMIWFRWRGNIEPQDVVFTNAVEPIRLDHPEREQKIGDMTYRSYHARGRFFLNYSSVERAYGTEIFGIAIHHRTLNRNNLMFVSDILGMDLNRGLTLTEQMNQANVSGGIEVESGDASLVQRLTALLPSSVRNADPLVAAMQQGRVLAGLSNWALERAWLSQETVRRGAQGDPAFVGFGKPQPEFSQLDLGGVLKPDQIKARDIVPPRFFLAIAIFGLVGSVLAAVLDFKDRGQFWRMQTLGLRLVSWPLLLVAGGNLALDHALQDFGTGTADALVLIYNALWWLVPARLLAISVERFIWVPLEIRAGRKVPNIIRMVVTVIIYLFSVFGVVAFVMGQTITSLLATSGLLAMIIGLAIQANIANIFSGIVLNLERPFKVGDFIMINKSVGEVIDITWRTMRMRSVTGNLVCLANAKVSEAEIHNFSVSSPSDTDVQIMLSPDQEPERIVAIIESCLIDIPDLAGQKSPEVRFKGVDMAGERWVARYGISYTAPKFTKIKKINQVIWNRLWHRLHQEGISWVQPRGPAERGDGAIHVPGTEPASEPRLPTLVAS
ncbi:MAG: ABC transporter substrate-binding protein [Azospirillum sp.]|nr:ABC transporter substrate-binding protein [Azospirillum sp.]